MSGFQLHHGAEVSIRLLELEELRLTSLPYRRCLPERRQPHHPLPVAFPRKYALYVPIGVSRRILHSELGDLSRAQKAEERVDDRVLGGEAVERGRRDGGCTGDVDPAAKVEGGEEWEGGQLKDFDELGESTFESGGGFTLREAPDE